MLDRRTFSSGPARSLWAAALLLVTLAMSQGPRRPTPRWTGPRYDGSSG